MSGEGEDTASTASATPVETPPPSQETWRTMARLLGRAWLVRDRTAVSGGVAGDPGHSLIHLGFAPASSGFGLFARGPPPELRPSTVRSGATAGRDRAGTVGGVASFVVDVAAVQPPLDPEASHVRIRAAAHRHHRGIHCRLGGAPGQASHNPCQRPALLG